MFKKFKFNHFSAILDYKDTFFKNKPEDCIIYSEDGSNFRIHKELLGQTEFLRKILFTANSQCCGTIEIICPCTKEELARLVHFLYHGEIQCDNVFDYFKSQEDLSQIFGFPEDFNIECQIVTLLDDPTLSSIIDVALYNEIINSVDNEMITQSSDLDFLNQDMRETKVGDEISSNFESTNGSMVDRNCPTEVEINLNNNLVNETYINHGVDENLEGYNAPFNGSLEEIEEETVENTVDEIAMETDSERILSTRGSMLDQICPTEFENDLNNNKVDETNIVISEDDEMNTQSSEIDFIVQDEVCSNFEDANNDSVLEEIMFDQIDLNKNLIHETDKNDENLEGNDALFNGSLERIEEETVENTMDEIDTANNYERNLLAHSLMVYKGCPTEVYHELNSNLVFQTDIGHGVDENLEGMVMNETKKSEMQGVNGNVDKSFESECVDENDVTETCLIFFPGHSLVFYHKY